MSCIGVGERLFLALHISVAIFVGSYDELPGNCPIQEVDHYENFTVSTGIRTPIATVKIKHANHYTTSPYIYMPTYIHACMHACMHTYTYTHINTYKLTYLHIHTYTHTHTHTHNHTYTYTQTYTYMNTQTYPITPTHMYKEPIHM